MGAAEFGDFLAQETARYVERKLAALRAELGEKSVMVRDPEALKFRGPWYAGLTVKPNDIVRHEGALWWCSAGGITRPPGHDRHWGLLAGPSAPAPDDEATRRALFDRWEGVWTEGKQYRPGDLVTHGSGLWIAKGHTVARPGNGETPWHLVIKGPRDTRDKQRVRE
jgi:hypothetical protein